jgi:chromosomal replication initiator protein
VSVVPDVTYSSADRNLFVTRLGVDLGGFTLPDRPRCTIKEIQRAVCDRYGLDINELLSDRRDRCYTYPRQVAMWLSRKLTANSLPGIGRRFGNRDHTTVLHAFRKIEDLRQTDPDAYRAAEMLLRDLASPSETL